MSRFSNVLTDCLKAHTWTESHLATKCGVPQSKINRWACGRTAPKQDSLLVVLPHFDPPEQALLIRAYLHDELPEQFRHLVEITPTNTNLAEPAGPYAAKPQRPDGISDTLWAQVCRCAELARDVPEVAAIFAEFDRLIQRRAIQP